MSGGMGKGGFGYSPIAEILTWRDRVITALCIGGPIAFAAAFLGFLFWSAPSFHERPIIQLSPDEYACVKSHEQQVNPAGYGFLGGLIFGSMLFGGNHDRQPYTITVCDQYARRP